MNEDKATRYHRLRRRALLSAAGLTGLLFTLMLLTGASKTLRDFVVPAASTDLAWLFGVVLFALCVGLCYEVITLPPRVYLGRLERRYRPSMASSDGAVQEYLEGTAVLLSVGPVGAVAMYAAIQAWPSSWWIIVGVSFSLVVMLLVKVGPIIVPWFATVTPVVRPELGLRLKRLAARAGAADIKVYQYRMGSGSRRSIAALVGVGQNRRILLSDTLVTDYSDEEIEIVLAHELAHHLHADIWKGLLIDLVMIMVGCYTASRALVVLGPSLGLFGSSDPAGLPLVILTGGTIAVAMMPFANFVSRQQERRADRFALELTRSPEAFVSVIRRIGEEHLAERPSPWLAFLCYAHPPVHERIATAGNLT